MFVVHEDKETKLRNGCEKLCYQSIENFILLIRLWRRGIIEGCKHLYQGLFIKLHYQPFVSKGWAVRFLSGEWCKKKNNPPHS